MRVLLFGASGMVGQGVLRECLAAEDVTEVLAVVRAPLATSHAKLRVVEHKDFLDYGPLTDVLRGVDACFFCLGVSSAGMSEADYSRVTYDVALAAARALFAHSPNATLIYVSGAGTDSSAQGRTMWARVKGKTENDLMAMSTRAFMFRPGGIRPMHGERSKTPLYSTFYVVLAPLLAGLRAVAPSLVTTTEEVGRAMLRVAREGAPQRVLENLDIVKLGAAPRGAH